MLYIYTCAWEMTLISSVTYRSYLPCLMCDWNLIFASNKIIKYCLNQERETKRHPVKNSMTQRIGKQALHFLCFVSNINVLRKLFKNRELHSTTGVCEVNLGPPTSRILAVLFLAC